MNLSKSAIERIAKLAHLNLNEQDKEEFITSIMEILDHISSLENVATEDVDPMISPLEETLITGRGRTREDRPEKIAQSVEDILNNAPLAQDHFFVVPKVVE